MRTDARELAKNGSIIFLLCSMVILTFFIARSSLMASYPQLSTAITIDLLITAPLAYFFLIRKTAIPNKTVFPFLILCIAFASFILPSDNRDLLDDAIVYLLPIAEAVALLFVAIVIYRSRAAYKTIAADGSDTLETLRKVLVNELKLPMVARAAAFELSTIWFAFFKWRRKRTESHFSYHKTSGSIALLAVFIGMILAETLVVHYLVGLWDQTAAWILTAISLYFVLQLFAHSKALVLRPIEIRDAAIFFRCGLIGDAEIAFVNVGGISRYTCPEAENKDALTITPAGGMTEPNVTIEFERPQIFNSVYGFQKSISSLNLTIDDPDRFIEQIAGKINR